MSRSTSATSRRRRCGGAAVVELRSSARDLIGLLFPVIAGLLIAAAAAAAPVDHPSERMPLAIRSLILDIGQVGRHVVAVGERGHILISEDGRSFRQVPAPVRSTLTAVSDAAGAEAAFAVGHDGVILRTSDDGLSWQLVFSAPEEDRPLLDVARLDDRTVLAIGAYGWLVRSEDDGATWTARSTDDDEPHLNGLALDTDGTLMIAAEFGLVYESADQGRTFERHELPYEGSFFGAQREARAWLVFGLRGHVFRREDDAQEWAAVDTQTDASLMTSLRLPDGRTLIAGLDGTLLLSKDGSRFDLAHLPDRTGVAALAETGNGRVLLGGEGGLKLMSDPNDPSGIVPVAAASR